MFLSYLNMKQIVQNSAQKTKFAGRKQFHKLFILKHICYRYSSSIKKPPLQEGKLNQTNILGRRQYPQNFRQAEIFLNHLMQILDKCLSLSEAPLKLVCWI